ncbi:hypothetical protein [Candidatus Symbiopectobacterium sp.]|uniref:hypothetical protein n=1 Tax=Candidatus Symbiopectobacterium sp. TaxID=2816440 RepID=UPI0025C415FD|nr:hypothetical protein [Candidatus Symbiopectobacterium sp.]
MRGSVVSLGCQHKIYLFNKAYLLLCLLPCESHKRTAGFIGLKWFFIKTLRSIVTFFPGMPIPLGAWQRCKGFPNVPTVV